MADSAFMKENGLNGSSGSERMARDLDETSFAVIQSLRTAEGSRQYVQSLSTELLLRDDCDWGAILSHAPRALCSMAQCFVAASTPVSSRIELSSSKDLKYKSLKGNLVHCSDLGRAAFRKAQEKMEKLTMYTSYICDKNGTIEKILKSLEDDTLAKHEMPRQLARLEEFALECVEDAKAVRNEFATWQEKAAEIRRVCTDEEHRAAVETNRLADDSAAQNADAKNLVQDIERLKLEMVGAKDDVNFHRQQYVQASKPFSPGWEGVAQRYVGDVINVVSQTVQVAAKFYAVNHVIAQSPLGFLAAPLMSKLGNRSSDPKPELEKCEDVNDYGFEIAHRILPTLETLVKFMGEDGDINSGVYGMDWKTLSGQTANHQFSIYSIYKSVIRIQEDPHLKNSKTIVSREVENILLRVLSIVKEIQDSYKKERQIQGTGIQQLDPSIISGWRTKLRDALDNNQEILERRKTAAAGDRISSKNAKPQTTSKSKKISNLRHLRENYEGSQKMLSDAQDRLREKTDRERRAQDKFNSIQQQLENLQSETVTIDEVRNILNECTQNLSSFQQDLEFLIGFFSSLHNLVDTTYKTQGVDFSQQAAGLKQIEGEMAQEERAWFKQQQMNDLREQSLQLRAYYAVMREISATYVDVSNKFIMPGVNQLDQLSLPDPASNKAGMSKNQIHIKTKQISQYAQGAQEKINELASKRKKALLDQLMTRKGEAEEMGYMIEQAVAADPEINVEDMWAI